MKRQKIALAVTASLSLASAVAMCPLASPAMAAGGDDTVATQAQPILPSEVRDIIRRIHDADAVAQEAVSWIGGPRYEKDAFDLERAIDAPHFVLAVYDRAGVLCPGLPLSNMERYGEIIHWAHSGDVALAGKTETLTDPPPLTVLRPGDRLVFEYDGQPAGEAGGATDIAAQTLGPERRDVGIYIGRYRNIPHAFVRASFKKGTVVVESLDEERNWATYRCALRGADERFPDPTNGGKAAPLAARSLPAPTASSGVGVNFAEKGNVVTVSIGVSKYGSDTLAMPSAAGDAVNMSRALTGLYGTRYNLTNSKTVTAAVSKGNLLSSVETGALRTGPDDVFVVYVTSQGRDGALLPSEFDPANAEATTVSLDGLTDRILYAPARRALIVMDSPHVSLSQRSMNRLRSSGKSIVLCLAAAREETPRTDDYGASGPGSVFTHDLLRGLGGAADTNLDGKVTVAELSSFVRKAVGEETLAAQTPSFITLGAAGPATVLSDPRMAGEVERAVREAEEKKRLAALAAAAPVSAPVAPVVISKPLAATTKPAPKPAAATPVTLAAGRLVALTVGISEYATLNRSLASAATDAGRFTETLGSVYGGRYDGGATVRAVGKVNRQDLLKSLDAAASTAGAGDILAIYLSAQGNNGGLLTSDADLKSGRGSTVSESVVLDHALKSAAHRLLIVWDASFGGNLPGDLSQKIADSGKDVLVFFASKRVEKSYTRASGSAGESSIFLHYLSLGLGGAADANKDGDVTLGELRAYVSRMVKEETTDLQSPVLLSFGKFTDAGIVGSKR